MRQRVLGIDFSGAEEAGKAIWIAEGRIENGRLRIADCRSAASRFGYAEREHCLAALVELVAAGHDAVFGFDFPFGLPGDLFPEASWSEFVPAFVHRYDGPEAFRDDCRRRTGGKEPKRATDLVAKTPWAAFNLKLYRQTYYGIARLLYPLVRDGAAAVLPMQRPSARRPWLIETCPASLLQRENLYVPYKGGEPGRRAARNRILRSLTARGLLAPLPRNLRRAAIENKAGDALDAMIAAVAAHRALHEPGALARSRGTVEAREGRVYY